MLALWLEVKEAMVSDQPTGGRRSNRRGDERRRSILNSHRAFVDDHGYSPSVREIADEVGLKSTSAVAYHLKILHDDGRMTRDAGRARASVVKLSNAGANPARTGKAGQVPAVTGLQDMTNVPFFERIAAGTPVIANGEPEDILPLPRALVGYGDVFAIKVAGDSMINAGIFDGDIAFVRRQDDARNGDIVAARFGEEVTVKTFRLMNNRAWLFPQNPIYEPIPGDDCHIMGKVVGTYRRI
jgi:repressor LexA